MFPIIARFGSVAVYSFGLFLLFSFLTCLYVVWKRTREEGLPEEKVIDVFFLATAALIVFGRIGFVVDNLAVFREDFGRVLLFIKYPGESFVWGLLFGSIATVLLARLFLLPALKVLDIFFLGISAATGIFLIGCFFAGSFFENRFLPLILGVFSLFFFFLLKVVVSKIRSNPELHEFRTRFGWLTLCYLIFISLSFLISSYVLTKTISRFSLVVLLVTVALFLVRYYKFLKGVKWSSFPKASLNNFRTILKREKKI